MKMKRASFSFLLLCIFFTAQINAQEDSKWNLNIELGANIGSILTYYSNDSTGLNLGSPSAHIGVASVLSINYNISNKFALISGINFDQFGFSQKRVASTGINWFTSNYLGIPFYLKWQLSDKVGVQAGVSGNLLLANNVNSDVRPYILYGQLGCNYDLRSLTLKIAYKHFITPNVVFNYQDTQFGDIEIKQRFFSVNVSLLYNLYNF